MRFASISASYVNTSPDLRSRVHGTTPVSGRVLIAERVILKVQMPFYGLPGHFHEAWNVLL